MGYIVGTILLAVVAVLCFLGWHTIDRRGRVAAAASQELPPRDRMVQRGLGTGSVAMVGGILLLTVFSSLTSIGTGHVGIVYGLGGKIDGEITGNGMTMVAPWQSVRVVSYKQQSYSYKLEAFSSETQDVFLDATVQYRLDPTRVSKLYAEVGGNWFDIVLLRRLQQFPKDETVRYRSVEVAPNREKMRKNIRLRLQEELQPFGVQVVDYLVDNIDFPAAFKEAITAKQVATQDSLRAQQLVQKAKYEAESRVASAQGIADATVIQAKADAEKNRLISQSITPTLVEYVKAQALQKANTIYVPSQWQAFANAGTTTGR